jgi:hypothetical protein
MFRCRFRLGKPDLAECTLHGAVLAPGRHHAQGFGFIAAADQADPVLTDGKL